MKEGIIFEEFRDEEHRATVYRLHLPDVVRMRSELDSIDIAMIKECSGSDRIADKLLALEVIVRRSEAPKINS